MKRTIRRSAIVVTVGFGALLAMPYTVIAAESQSKSLEALAAGSANTAEQHHALAAFYRQKEASAREDVKQHREMSLSYSSHSASGMTAHCNNLAKAAEQQATEYEALAAFHDGEAKKSGK